jgi:hypothetical protein
MGYIPGKEMAGGSGLKYISDCILYLGKRKDKDDTTKEVFGNILTIKVIKSRLSRENTEVSCRLSYKTGLDRYYGLIDFALSAGILTKAAKGYADENGEKVSEKSILNNPEKFYTKDRLDKIEAWVNKNFKYGYDDVAEEDDFPEIEGEDNVSTNL